MAPVEVEIVWWLRVERIRDVDQRARLVDQEPAPAVVVFAPGFVG